MSLPAPATPHEPPLVNIVPRLDNDKSSREIGSLAVWSVTSAKPGNGVDMVRDDKVDTYWQSDGLQPHLVNIQFQKKVRLTLVAVYLDYRLDESYTPNKVAVRAGSSFHDLKELRCVDLEEPSGWVLLSLVPEGSTEPLKAHLLQLQVLSNHQNGRDTHVRQIKVFGPREDVFRAPGLPLSLTSPEACMYATVR